MLAPRHGERIDDAHGLDRPAPDALQLHVEEADIEGGVVDDEPRIGDEVDEVLGDGGEDRLVREEGVGQAVDPEGPFRHRPLGIDVDVEAAAARAVIDQLDAADLDDAVAGMGFDAGGLGIEDDFSQCLRGVGI